MRKLSKVIRQEHQNIGIIINRNLKIYFKIGHLFSQSVICLVLISLLFFTQLFCPCKVFAQDISAISFDEAFNLVLKSDPGVISAKNALEVANLKLAAAKSLGFPTVTLNAFPITIARDKFKLESKDSDVLTFWDTGISSNAGLGISLPINDGNISFSVDGSYSKLGSFNSKWESGWKINFSWPILGKGSSIGSAGGEGSSGINIGSYEDQIR